MDDSDGSRKLRMRSLGTLLILLVLWGLARGFGGDAAPSLEVTPTNPGRPGAGAPTAKRDITDWPALPLAQTRSTPNRLPSSLTGVGTVGGVVSKNAFWIESEGERLLVVVRGEDPGVNLREGDLVRLDEAQLMRLEEMPQNLRDSLRLLVLDGPVLIVHQGKFRPI